MKQIEPWKWVIAIVFDLIDFLLGWIPGFGEIWDVMGTAVAIILWGNVGILAAWEVLDFVDASDAPIPTVTLIGILTMVRK